MASNESAVLFDQPGPKGRKTIRIVNWIAGIIFAVVVVLILMRLLMIFFWRWFAFAGLPSPAYWAVVLALVIYNGSVVAELVRSGVGNLPNGQREASLALGLTRTQSLLQIEVPQAIYAMLPAAVTQLVVVLKDTALGSIIMYTDLLQESRRLGSMYFNILQTLVVAAVVYFIVCWLLSRLAEWLPSRMQQHTAAPAEPEPVAPIAIMDPSNVNQIAVAKEGVPLGGAQRVYHVHHQGQSVQDEGRWQGQEQVRSRRIAPVSHNTRRGRFPAKYGEAAPFVSTMDCTHVVRTKQGGLTWRIKPRMRKKTTPECLRSRKR